ncbi:MAG: hypothetical protein KF812_04915 [Fimbriimonadaceae bacterium]|nr:hypothetical protein [Fimbriimonadaceae bacterium]
MTSMFVPATLLVLSSASIQAAYSPRVLMSPLLESRLLLNNEKPQMDISKVQIAFPPSSNADVRIKVYKGEELLNDIEMKIGVTVGNLVVASMPQFSFVDLGTGTGPRRIDVTVDGKLAGRLDFTLTQTSGGDALVPTKGWDVEGPWSQLAYFTYKDEQVSRNDVTIFYWVKESEVPVMNNRRTVKVTIRNGNTVIGTSDDRYPSGPGYSRLTHPFKKANGQFLDKTDLNGFSSPLTVEVKAGEKVLRSWRVTPGGAGFAPHPRTNLDGTEPQLWLSPKYINGQIVQPVTLTWLVAGN